MKEPKPCPFCQGVLRPSGNSGFTHPTGDCFLSGYFIGTERIVTWNNRK